MIGEIIKKYRLDKDMSQFALAQAIGASASTVGMYEQNRRKPDIDMLKKIAKVLNIHSSVFFDVDCEDAMPDGMGEKYCDITKIFGVNLFSKEVMKKYVSEKTFMAWESAIENGHPLSIDDAQEMAMAMKNWAVEKGATHYSHWFQPLTGLTAEKQDSFIEMKDGKAIMQFSGKTLIKGETDASSFPSGGLRATFEARGYTTWDCTSPVFIREDVSGHKTMVIPTAFCSYNGLALDKKTPLLRSIEALNKQAIRVLRQLGDDKTESVMPTVGSEQEYFLVEDKLYKKRRDLMFAGRTLFGANPPKGQELGDQYYAAINERTASFMKDLNYELWKLGVVAKTQHNEAAPAQYELALLYDTCNVAVDQNQLVMETLKRVARRHNLACLLHEKPFENINGSGKHNNWSLVTNDGQNIFKPGNKPNENLRFLLFFSAVIAGVDEYASVLRAACANMGNEHRIGGFEAPPAIISVSTGQWMEDILNKVRRDKDVVEQKREYLEMGVSTMPHFKMDHTDRNRTSPFAFTGDKFEFRMVGSGQSLSGPNTNINTIMAEMLSRIATRLEAATNKEDEAHEIIKDLINQHWKIIFNGNNYSDEWIREAKRRGLPMLDDTVSALCELDNDYAIELFNNHNVYNPLELSSRVSISLEVYAKCANIEATSMIGMINDQFIPACVKYNTALAHSINEIRNACADADCSVQQDLLIQCSKYLVKMKQKSKELEKALSMVKSEELDYEKAKYAQEIVCPLMRELRHWTDSLEEVIDKELWPVPTFADLLFY